MTCARVKGCHRIRSNSEREIDCLGGLVGVTEDWHAKMSFLGVSVYVCYSVDRSHCCVQVIWKRLYKCSSGGDGGTLYQLRNLIQRRNVVNDPSRNMNACEDFFTLIVEAHILAAAMSAFEMSSVDDIPVSVLFSNDCCSLNKDDRYTILQLEVTNVVEKYVRN